MHILIRTAVLTIGILGFAIQAAALEVVELRRVSVASDGSEANGDSGGPAISPDGRFISFESIADNVVVDDTNGVNDVFSYDSQTGQTRRVSVASDGSEANGSSRGSVISADSRHVAFGSDADNLVATDLNGIRDLFVHDLTAGETTRVNVASDGSEANDVPHEVALSADGRLVIFASTASNLVTDDTNGFRDIGTSISIVR